MEIRLFLGEAPWVPDFSAAPGGEEPAFSLTQHTGCHCPACEGRPILQVGKWRVREGKHLPTVKNKQKHNNQELSQDSSPGLPDSRKPNVFQTHSTSEGLLWSLRAAHPISCYRPMAMPPGSILTRPPSDKAFPIPCGPTEVPAYREGSFQTPLLHEAPWLLSFSSERLGFCLSPPRGCPGATQERELDCAPTTPLHPQPPGQGQPESSSSQLLVQTQGQNLGTSSPTAAREDETRSSQDVVCRRNAGQGGELIGECPHVARL